MITKAQLQKFAPRPRQAAKAKIWDDYVSALVDNQSELFKSFSNLLELQHFLAQIAHESGGFTILWESGAYSADRIMDIFGVGKHSAKVTRDEADDIAKIKGERRAEVLFERVYGLGNKSKAKELGNVDPGDGYKYRGFGLLQTTGRTHHEQLIGGDYTALGSFRAAVAEWAGGPCPKYARQDDIRKVTKTINGGYNNLDDRIARLEKAKSIFTADALSAPETPIESPLPGPKPTVKDLEQMGSKKAKVVRKGFWVTVWGGIVSFFSWLYSTFQSAIDSISGTVGEKIGLISEDPGAAKDYLDGLTSLLAPARVVMAAVADNVLVILVVALASGAGLLVWLGRRMVDDLVQGKYVPPGNSNGSK